MFAKFDIATKFDVSWNLSNSLLENFSGVEETASTNVKSKPIL